MLQDAERSLVREGLKDAVLLARAEVKSIADKPASSKHRAEYLERVTRAGERADTILSAGLNDVTGRVEQALVRLNDENLRLLEEAIALLAQELGQIIEMRHVVETADAADIDARAEALCAARREFRETQEKIARLLEVEEVLYRLSGEVALASCS